MGLNDPNEKPPNMYIFSKPSSKIHYIYVCVCVSANELLSH